MITEFFLSLKRELEHVLKKHRTVLTIIQKLWFWEKTILNRWKIHKISSHRDIKLQVRNFENRILIKITSNNDSFLCTVSVFDNIYIHIYMYVYVYFIFLNKISSSNIGISLLDVSLAFHKMTTYPVLDREYSSFYFKVAVTSIVWLLAIRCRKERNMVLYYYVDYFFYSSRRIFESFPLCLSLETGIIPLKNFIL